MKTSLVRLWLKNWFSTDNPASFLKKSPVLNLQLLECRTMPAMLDVSSGTVTFTAAAGINDNLSVSLVRGNYNVTDTADTIALTPAAINAGWAGSGTNAVTGPSSGVTLLNLNLADGTDTLEMIAGGSANVNVTATANLNVAGLVSSACMIAISGASDLTDSTGGGILQGASITLLSSTEIGTVGDNLIVAGANPTVIATSGASGVYITSTDGVNVSASASGAGNVSLTNNLGTLTVIPGGIDANGVTTTGNIRLSSSGAITLSGNIGCGAFSGTISIAGDTSGTLIATDINGTRVAAPDAFEQNGQSLITENTTSSAATITVNSPNSGTGAASIGEGSIGSTSGGTITVNSYGGNIVWCDSTGAQTVLGTWGDTDPQTGIDGAGSNSAVLAASNYVFTATGGSTEIGSSARPIQAAAFGAKILQTSANSTLGSAALAAGSGGIYFVDWSPANAANSSMTLNSAISYGGDIRVVTAQATGHALFVDGPVWTESGSIEIYSDDDIILQGATVGGIYQGVAFSGKVSMAANRDAANEQTLAMESLGGISSSIVTTNTSSSAIVLTDAPSIGGFDDVDRTLPQGGIDLQNVTCGNGGTITVNAAADAVAEGIESNQQGNIVQEPGYSINAGIKGTVSLTARSWQNSDEYLVGGLGVAGTPTEEEYLPIEITADKIVATTTGSEQPNSGSIDIIALTPATFSVISGEDALSSGYFAGNNGADVILSDTSTAGPMTIAAASTGEGTEPGGSVTLTGTDDGGGVTVSGTLGSSTSGEITINGPLSGSGSINLGTDKLILNQDIASQFDGVISGAHSVTLEGGGTLTLTKTHRYTLGTEIESGTTLLVNGSIAASSDETVLAGGVLGGNGGTVGNVTVEGILAPGNIDAAGILNTGSLSFAASGAFDADLNGTTAGSGFSLAVASGPLNLNNAMLNLSIGSNLSITQPQQFDILVNTSGQAINGTFANLPEGAFGTTSNGLEFQITYHGGASDNDVVVTVFPNL